MLVALGTITQEFFESILSESIAGGTPTPEQIIRINEIIECFLDAGIVFEPESAGLNAQEGAFSEPSDVFNLP